MRLAITRVVGMGAMLAAGVCAHAQDDDAGKAKPAQQQQPQPQQPAREPTLDELLGLGKPAESKPVEGKPVESKPAESKPAESKPAEGKPVDSTRSELDRQLASSGQPSDELEKAIALMRESEARLKANDAGAQTQRVQDETLKLLDKLIEQAKQNQQKQKQQKQQQKQQQKGQSQQQQQQQKQSSQQQQGKPQQQQQQQDGDGKGGTPQSAQAQTKQLPQGAQAVWGNLPPHVRDALMQGASDTYSSTWEQMTSDYYKRLAEQNASQPGGQAGTQRRNP